MPGSICSPESLTSWPTTGPLIQSLADLWTPPTRLPLSQWVEKNFVLSSEYSAKTGLLRLFPWQREIFDSFTDPRVEETVCCTGVQLVKSLFIQSCIAYVAIEDPGPILLLQPKEDACLAFSKRRLTPMIRDMPALGLRMSDSSNSGKATLLSKDFPGGNLLIVSANTPVDVAQHTIRFVLCDEPDKYKASAGKEGDPMDLAWERAGTFGSRKKRVMCCSPTIAGFSRIGRAYKASDMRRPWVPCPYCNTFQVLKWEQVKGAQGDSFLHSGGSDARYECINTRCKARWVDEERLWACDRAEWRTEKPFLGIAGFWISHLYSPWKKLSAIAKHFIAVKDDRTRHQVFINTVLAEEWQEEGSVPDEEKLFARREPYAYQEELVIPRRALFLTAAVDVQDNPPRLEVELAGWGRNRRERWSLGYWVLQARHENGQLLPITSPEFWRRGGLLDSLLQREFRHETGHLMKIRVMGIDTGSRSKPVYDFARQHLQLEYGPGGIRVPGPRVVVPTKGNDDDLRVLSKVSKEDAARKRQGVKIVTLGTHVIKQEIYDILLNVRPTLIPFTADAYTLSGPSVPSCYHFPYYDLIYFEGLCSEVRIVDPEDGSVTWKKRADRRNEPFDLAVINRGMAAVVGIDRFTESQWDEMEKALGMVPPATTNQSASVVTTEVPTLSIPPTALYRPPTLPDSPPLSPSPASHTSRVRGRFL